MERQENNFVKKVMTVALGTAGAQAIALASTPIITRLYEPSIIGQAGLFFAICAIFTQISTLCYANAIVLPEKESVAKVISSISIWIGGILTVISTAILFILQDSIVVYFGVGDMFFIIPFLIMTSAFTQVHLQWEIRKSGFKTISIVTFLNSIWINLGKVVLGLINPVLMFIILPLSFSYLIQLFFYRRKRSLTYFIFKKRRMILYAGVYKSFPLYKAPQVLLYTVSESIPMYFLAKNYGSEEVAFYVLAKSVLGIPLMLIGKSIGDVFYPKVVSTFNNKKDTHGLVFKYTIVLFFISLFPALILFFEGKSIFEFILGSDWSESGVFSSWMAIWFVSNFMNKPSVISIPVINKQRKQFIFEIFCLFLRVIVLYFGSIFFIEAKYTVASYSILNAILNLILIISVISYLKRSNN